MVFEHVGSFEGGHTIRTLVPSFVRMSSVQRRKNEERKVDIIKFRPLPFWTRKTKRHTFDARSAWMRCGTVWRMLCTKMVFRLYGFACDRSNPSSDRILSRKFRMRNFLFSDEPFRCECVLCSVMSAVSRIRCKTFVHFRCANMVRCQWWVDPLLVALCAWALCRPLGHRCCDVSSSDSCSE